MMKKKVLVAFLIVVNFCVWAQNSGIIGKVDLVSGTVRLHRDGGELRPKRGTDLYIRDKLSVTGSGRLVVRLADGSKVSAPLGNYQPVSDMIQKALSQRSKNALSAFQGVLSSLSKEDGHNDVMVATMGARGMFDQNNLKSSVDQIDELLVSETDKSRRIELMKIQADLYLDLGNLTQARAILERLNQLDPSAEMSGLADLLKNVSDCIIAVSLFDSESRKAAEFISDQIVTDLSKSGLLTIVERSNMEKVLKEQELAFSDLTGQATIKVGTILQADYMITGKITKLDSVMVIAARIVDIESGQVLKAWDVQGKSAEPLFYSQQLSSMIHVELTGKDVPEQRLVPPVNKASPIGSLDEVELYLGFDKEGSLPKYTIGDEIKFYFKLKGKASLKYYVTIMSVGPDGEVNLLFPNDYHSNNAVITNKEMSLPDEKADYNFQVYGKEGKNILVGIVTATPLNLVDKETLEKEVFPVLSSSPGDFLDRGIRIQAEKSKVKKWKIAECYFMAEKE